MSARYDEEREHWMYKLTDLEGKMMSRETEEQYLYEARIMRDGS